MKNNKKSSSVDKQKVLEEKVRELEEKIESLEHNTKEAKRRRKFSNIKKFVVKHKVLVIATLVILVLFVSWEIFSLYSYRNYLHSAFSAQQDGRFEEAANDLGKVKQVIHRSPTLYILRRESVEDLIRNNQDYIEIVTQDIQNSQEKEEKEDKVETQTGDMEIDEQDPNGSRDVVTESPPTIDEQVPNDSKDVVTASPPTIPESIYATVRKLTDSKGNFNYLSEYNGGQYTWPSPYPSLKVGETVTITVDVLNTTANPVLYQFNGRGFPNIWQSSNQVTINVDNETFNLENIHLRVFVRNSDNQYRAPEYDDMIQIFYKKVQ